MKSNRIFHMIVAAMFLFALSVTAQTTQSDSVSDLPEYRGSGDKYKDQLKETKAPQDPQELVKGPETRKPAWTDPSAPEVQDNIIDVTAIQSQIVDVTNLPNTSDPQAKQEKSKGTDAMPRAEQKNTIQFDMRAFFHGTAENEVIQGIQAQLARIRNAAPGQVKTESKVLGTENSKASKEAPF